MTSTESPAVAPQNPTLQSLPMSDALSELENALGGGQITPQPSESKKQSAVSSSLVSKGKKNPRFGKNPDGSPAPKAVKKEIIRKSEWGRFLHAFKEENPDLYPLEATIEARKLYTPKSGKQKSFERIYSEVWKQRNPKWAKMSKEERTLAIRNDFIKAF